MAFFPLVSPSGVVVRTMRADPLPVASIKSDTKRAPASSHLILVIDQSGSMYYDMKVMQATLLKLLTLEEYRNEALLVSLVSYSSNREVYEHFTRTPITTLMRPGSDVERVINGLRATNLTCISGGLESAARLVRDDEATTIVLHSDGYANDPSPYSETRSIGAALDALATRPNVMVSTVSYGNADFALLDMIATRGGGACVQAKSAGQVFDALAATSKPAANKAAAPLRFTGKGLLVGLSRSGRKVMSGTNGELVVRGLKPEDDLEVWEVNEGEVDGRLPAHGGSLSALVPALLYARAVLAAGQLNAAKQVVLGLRAQTLYPHLRALTSPQIAAFAQALDAAIFGDLGLSYAASPGLPDSGVTVMDVLDLLRQHSGQYLVNVPMLTEGRQRRSIARKAGAWVDGKIVSPVYTTRLRNNDPWARVGAIEMNRAAATINMNITRPCDLVNNAGEVVHEVAGVPLDLKDYRNITVVADGNVVVGALHLKVTDKRLSKRLAERGFLPVEGVTAIPLAEMTVVNGSEAGTELIADTTIVDRLVACRIARGILDAALEEQSVKYTAEQVEEFKRYSLSKSGGYSPTTVNPYEDREAAIRTGAIDSYTTFKIDLGNTTLLSLSDLPSANEFLQRRFSGVTTKGEAVKKPTFAQVMRHECMVSVKPAAAIKRLELGPADTLMMPWLEGFLDRAGETDHGAWEALLAAAGVDAADAGDFLRSPLLADTDLLSQVRSAISHYEDTLVAQVLAPTVLYTGSTGFLPDALAEATVALTADELEDRCPGLKVPKAKRDATFFLFNDGRVLSVRPETAWYST